MRLKIKIALNYSILMILCAFLSCKQPQIDSKQSKVIDSISMQNSAIDTVLNKNVPQGAKYDLSKFVEDSSFINNKVKFIIWRDTTEHRCISIVIERILNNQRDTILEFTAKKEFRYSIRDIDGDGNFDIRVNQDPIRRCGFFMFNPLMNRFIDNDFWNPVWKKLGQGVCYDMPESLKGPMCTSNLVVVENGMINGLGYISIEENEDESVEKFQKTKEEEDNSFFSKPPKATLNKIKKGHFRQIEWTEEISPDLVKKYFTKDEENYEGFVDEIWKNNYKRFQ